MKKILILVLLTTIVSLKTSACPFCNKQIADAIYDSTFYPNLLTMLSAFFALALIVIILSHFSNKKYSRLQSGDPETIVSSPVPLYTASMVSGIGFGGFADGIVFHQIMQWHEMLSNKIPATDYIGKSVNMFWDGIFHAFCLLVCILGIILLWKLLWRKNIERSGKLFAGGLLSGWGLFNIIEGIIDHHLLKLHNVMEYARDPDTANYLFLGVSVLMIIFSNILIKRRKIIMN